MPASTPLWLTTAGWGLAIHCEDEELRSRLAQRYASFLVSSAPSAATSLRIEGTRQFLPGSAPLRSRVTGGTITVSDGTNTWAQLDRQTSSGRVVPHRSLAAVDVLIRSELTLRALEAGGCTLHAACVVVNGQAHLFAGPSGAGKSTVAEHLAREGCHVLTDEFSVLTPGEDGRWWAHGTPFWLGKPGKAPLKAVWKLVRDGKTTGALGANERLRHLTGNLSLMLEDRAFVEPSLAAVAKMAGAVAGFELCYALGEQIASRVESAS